MLSRNIQRHIRVSADITWKSNRDYRATAQEDAL
jgi:hypothetical protein